MNMKHFLRTVGVTLIIILFGVTVSAVSADDGLVEVDFATLNLSPGESVVGVGKIADQLIIGDSGGNDVQFLVEGEEPAAYGSIPVGQTAPVINACMPNGVGFADLNPNNLERNHEYDFTFTDEQTVSMFSVGIADWADYLPFGANDDGIYALTLTGYDADGNVVDSDTYAFESPDSGFARRAIIDGELVDLVNGAGDACRAAPGEPGTYTFVVEGTGIVEVELRFKDRPSVDPNISIFFVSYRLESANQPPVAEDDTESTDLNTPVTVPVLDNDSDPDGDVIVIDDYETTTSEGGEVVCVDGECTYTPPFGFTGEDTFTYTICDPEGLCDTATVTITVVNDPTSTGCTKTQGYWKTHASGRKYDATWDQVDPDSAFFLSGETYLSIMTSPTKGHAYYILGQQYVATEMNMRSGASIPNDVLAAFQQAKAMFETMTPEEMGRKNDEAKALSRILDDYNNGVTGPGHCN